MINARLVFLALLCVIGLPAVCSASPTPTYSRIIRPSSRSSRAASEWPLTGIIIRRGTYIANINLDAEYKGMRLIPGILVDRIRAMEK